jgi:hypothetical protein
LNSSCSAFSIATIPTELSRLFYLAHGNLNSTFVWETVSNVIDFYQYRRKCNWNIRKNNSFIGNDQILVVQVLP